MSVSELRQPRSTAKAAVTKVRTEIEGLLKRNVTDGLDSLVDKLKDKLSTLKNAHQEYMSGLTDQEDIDSEGNYYQDVANSAHELIQRVDNARSSNSKSSTADNSEQADAIKRLKHKQRLLRKQFQLEEQERKLAQQRSMFELEKQLIDLDGELSDDESDQDGSTKPVPRSSSEAGSVESCVILEQQRQLIDLLAAPKLEIPSFDGSPMHYYAFIKAFEDNVERVVSDHSSRLTRLLQYCTGPAKHLIQCCAMMSSDEGYRRARELLKTRFGSEFAVSQAFVERATNGPQIKGEKSLQAYSDDLRNCYETLRAMNCLAEINTQSNLVKVMAKLPSYLQNRWRREVSRIKREYSRLPSFHDLVTMVEDASCEANDPVFGFSAKAAPSESRPSASQSSTTAKQKKTATFATSTFQKREISCYNCKGSHTVYSCDQFKKMTADKRNETVREKNLCANCLRANHTANECRSEQRCRVCQKKHHTLLHVDHMNVHNGYIGGAHGAGEQKIALPVVAVKVRSPGSQRYVETYALLDGGSTNSFVSESLMRKLDIKGQPCKVTLTTLEKSDSDSWTTTCSLSVSDAYDTYTTVMPSVYSRASLPIRAGNIATCSDISAWPHLQGINLPSASAGEVELLIGQDSPESLIPRTVITGRKDEPFAIRTVLGWALNGPIGDGESTSVTSAFVTLNDQVEHFWKIDSAGLYSDKVEMSVEDKEVINLWDKNVCKTGVNYELPIPFTRRADLQNNRDMALSRLKSLSRKLRGDDSMHDQYTQGINELLVNNYAEEVEDADVSDRVWYLPHHPVVNPNKPKLRIVFDCAAKHKGLSLNDCVRQGPDLTNKLAGVLLRFREDPVAFMADIKAMFHQVKVPCADRDVLRFLWWPGGALDQPPKTYRMTSHIFGGCWSPSCCAYALQRSVQDKEPECSKLTRETVLRNFYVDDCLRSVPDVNTAMQLAEELRSVLQTAGFTLTKWTSNSRDFIKSIPIEERAPSARDLNFDALPVERALGVIWDTDQDTLTYRISALSKPTTKRGILSILSSVYDPLGLISPFILNARRIVQELFRRKAGWDDAAPDDLAQLWHNWTREVQRMENFAVPRCIMPEAMAGADRELHIFSDASEAAYGAVAYLRCTNHQGDVHTSLLTARSRLAPLKGMTVPRLELSAATLAARLDEQLREELKITDEPSYFWTDSTIVLAYLRNTSKRYKTFVSNRVTMIRELTDVANWSHVATQLNPADDCSRSMSADDLLCNHRWLHGPAFLKNPRSEWPQLETSYELPDSDPELKNEVVTLHSSVKSCDPVEQMISAYSSWTRLKRAVAWIILVKNVLIKRCKPKSELDTSDLSSAENVILRHAQLSLPRDGKAGKMLQSLNPVCDEDELLRARGRIIRAPIPERQRCPVILPKCRVSELIITEKHGDHGHVGREFTLSLTMEKYWIFGARGLIKDVLKKCVVCRRMLQAPGEQLMADLPTDRVTPGGHPFESVGCDYFGPFLVKRGRGREKRYGCLFTCLTTRAVHLEVAPALDADSFINCLQRFIARRGKPRLIRSDNGTNFVGAERMLREEIAHLASGKLQRTMTDRGIEWKFNPPAASHMGGVWERQIRSIRKVLAGLTREQLLTDDALNTLMCNIEAILNNRPLTAISTDPTDLEPLTPNHLLIMRAATSPPGDFCSADLYCRSRWRQVQYLADLFWRRWQREYLPQLQKRSKWLWKTRNLSVDDIVLVVDDNAPRNRWKLGRVLAAFKGSDGQVRSVKLRTNNSDITRPVSKLCYLECIQEPRESVTDKTGSQGTAVTPDL